MASSLAKQASLPVSPTKQFKMEGQMVIALILFTGLASGEVVKTQKCYLPAASQKSCTVHEVRLDPCPEAAEDKPCKIKLGTNVSLSFDYTPTFSAESMGSHVYKVNAMVDTAFEKMDTNGCKYTKCPVEANTKQTYVYSIEVERQFPAGVHQSKVKLWNQADRTQQCCFKMAVELDH